MRTQVIRTIIPRTSSIYSRTRMSSAGVPSSTAQIQKRSAETMASAPASGAGSGSGSPTAADLNIETTPSEAPGVKLTEQQKLLVGSVLDLFKGLPTLKKLQLWTDDAIFADPITIAEGRKQYAAQWYGLKAAFSQIDQLSQSVTSDKNPITVDLKTKYKLAGLGAEKIMESQVYIWTQPEGGADGEKLRIVKVEDRWNGGELPDGPFAKAFRNLNSVVVPVLVGVPKTEEEDLKKQQK